MQYTNIYHFQKIYFFATGNLTYEYEPLDQKNLTLTTVFSEVYIIVAESYILQISLFQHSNNWKGRGTWNV